MTEQEWLNFTDPTPMLEFLRGKVSERKVRLFSCACCRAIWSLLTPSERRAVRVAERYADGEVAASTLLNATLRPEVGCTVGATFSAGLTADQWILHAQSTAGHCPLSAAIAEPVERGPIAQQRVGAYQVAALQDVVGNPFQLVIANPSWLTSAVVALALGIYCDRAFDRLPILADALEDAECDNADILNHCRSSGPHVRGCWVVDLLLGKG